MRNIDGPRNRGVSHVPAVGKWAHFLVMKPTGAALLFLGVSSTWALAGGSGGAASVKSDFVLPAGYCGMSEADPGDRRVIQTLAENSRENEVLLAVANCEELSLWRAGELSNLRRFGSIQHPRIPRYTQPVSHQEYARTMCAEASQLERLDWQRIKQALSERDDRVPEVMGSLGIVRRGPAGCIVGLVAEATTEQGERRALLVALTVVIVEGQELYLYLYNEFTGEGSVEATAAEVEAWAIALLGSSDNGTGSETQQQETVKATPPGPPSTASDSRSGLVELRLPSGSAIRLPSDWWLVSEPLAGRLGDLPLSQVSAWLAEGDPVIIECASEGCLARCGLRLTHPLGPGHPLVTPTSSDLSAYMATGLVTSWQLQGVQGLTLEDHSLLHESGVTTWQVTARVDSALGSVSMIRFVQQATSSEVLTFMLSYPVDDPAVAPGLIDAIGPVRASVADSEGGAGR